MLSCPWQGLNNIRMCFFMDSDIAKPIKKSLVQVAISNLCVSVLNRQYCDPPYNIS